MTAMAIRMFAFVLGFFGIFLCCIGIGFLWIEAARDLMRIADEIEEGRA